MSTDIKFITRKRRNILLYKGHEYVKQKEYANHSSIWFCTKKQKLKCKGSITINENNEDIKTVSHINECKPYDYKNDVPMALKYARMDAATTSKSITKIYKEQIAPLKDKGHAFLSTVPSFQSTKHSLYNSRKQGFQVHKIDYKEFLEVEVPINFEHYLKADYYDPDDNIRILIFATDDALKLVNGLEEIFIDGTFKSVPSPFYQLIAIHGENASNSVTNKVNPLFFALLPNKEEKTYKVMFDLLTNVVPNFMPKIVHADFEFAIINALKTFFPKVDVIRCYYHFTNSLWSKAKMLRIKCKTLRRIVGLCCSLPLLPNIMILDGWNYIINEAEYINDKKLKQFVSYFEKFYLKKKFMDEWCVFNEHLRTKNVCESWIDEMNKKINKKNVTLAKLLGPNQKLTDGQEEIYQLSHNHIRYARMQLLANDISIGHFLEKLR